MSYKTFRLKAGVDMEAPIIGKILLVDSTGAADGIDITLRRGGQSVSLPNRQKAFKYVVDFDTVILRASVDCTVALFLSMTDVSLGFSDTAMFTMKGEVRVTNDPDNPVPVDLGGGAVTIANGPGNRVPVDLAGGVVEVTASNVGINNTEENPVPTRIHNDEDSPVLVQSQKLGTVVDLAPVLVAEANVAQVLVNDPALKRIRVRNGSQNGEVVVIGGSQVTQENAVIVLQPGDVWVENDAAGAAWYVASTAPGAKVQIQGVKK